MSDNAAAKLRRKPARGTTCTEIVMVVPCEFANEGHGGEHEIRVSVWDTGQLAVMRCECEGDHVGAARAMHRLGATGTCGHALGYLRRWALGEEGDASTFVHQHFSPAALAFIRVARDHARERRSANRAFPRMHAHEQPRLGPTLLSRLFAEGMGWTPEVKRRKRYTNPPEFLIKCDKDSRPIKALIDGNLVAKRARGVAGWRLLSGGMHAATFAVCSANEFGCPLCAMRTSTKADGVRFGFRSNMRGHSTTRRAHVDSKGHRETFERVLIETLSSLPGVGRTE